MLFPNIEELLENSGIREYPALKVYLDVTAKIFIAHIKDKAKRD